MTTRVYGESDDLIEFEGDVRGEVGHYDNSDEPTGVLLICSDGTLLRARYDNPGVWQIRALSKGSLFNYIEECNDPDASPRSDQVFFKDGLKWAYAATAWQGVS